MSTTVSWLFAIAATMAGSPAVAAPPDLYAIATTLRAGTSTWNGDEAVDGEYGIVVSLALQRAYVYRGDVLVGVAAVSTGKRGHATPLGTYPILQKARWHRSNLYSNAPMPFMQRLTWDGIALHAGQDPGRPASHGCIRLPPAFARALFRVTAIGDVVTVTDYPQVTIAIDWTAVDPPDAIVPRLEYQGFGL